MALMICPECGKEISDSCRKCPHCGVKIKKTRSAKSKKTMIILASAALLLVGVIVFEGFNLNWSAKELENIFDCGSIQCLFSHSWKKADCTRPMRCSACGSVRGQANGHQWEEATCTEPKTCSVCGETEGTALGHSWIAASCTEPKHCTSCGETEGNAAGHKWASATCKQPKHCTICGLESGGLADHKWSSATCTQPAKCSVCGKTKGTALGHNFKDFWCTKCNAPKTPALSDVPKILDITTLTYKINSVGGIEHTMAFTNKLSNKTIKYIYLELEMYNAVGDVISNEINRSQKTEKLTFVGPLGPGKSSGKVYWNIDFYNSSFSGTMKFLSIVIEYTDGTKLELRSNIANDAVVHWR